MPRPNDVPLSELSDTDFTDLVNRDVREMSSVDEAQSLRQTPEIYDRWYESLLYFKRNLEHQFSTNRANRAAEYKDLRNDPDQWAKYLAENESWRVGALKFYRGVEHRLREVKTLRAELHRTQYAIANALNDSDASHEVRKLRAAIAMHRAAITATSEDADTSTIDEGLWSVL